MSNFYHFTSNNNIFDIAHFGLMPKNGDRSCSIQDDTNAVFLSKGEANIVLMLAQMHSYYSRVKGKEGEENLNAAKVEYELYSMYNSWLANKKVEIAYNDIKRISQIRNIPTFKDYLGGNCVLLCVENLTVDCDVPPENCRRDTKIDPNDIEVVYLRDIYNNLYFDLEAIISYFSVKESFNDLSLEERERIGGLQEYLGSKGLYCLHPELFRLEKMPIKDYAFQCSYWNCQYYFQKNYIR